MSSTLYTFTGCYPACCIHLLDTVQLETLAGCCAPYSVRYCSATVQLIQDTVQYIINLININICGEVIRLLLKYCIYCASAPSLHRESTDSLIYRYMENLEVKGLEGSLVPRPHPIRVRGDVH